MALLIFAAFVGIPILEIALLIQVGGIIGLWPTLGIIILTAMLGTFLLRQQGLQTLLRAQEAMRAGELPLREVFHGACLLVGGAMLLTPGFVTDAVGFLLLIPWIRDLLGLWGLAFLRKQQQKSQSRGHYRETVIEGDFSEIHPNPPANDPNNPATDPSQSDSGPMRPTPSTPPRQSGAAPGRSSWRRP